MYSRNIIHLTQSRFSSANVLSSSFSTTSRDTGVTNLPKTERSNIMSGRIVWLFHLLCSTDAALQMTGPSTYEARVGSVAHIPCTFTADKLPVDPKYFAVVWDLEGKHILSYDNTVTSTDPRYSLDKDRALNGNASLMISNTFLSDVGTYTCSVTDSPLRREKEIKVEISGAALQMTGPSTYEARVGSVAHIPCTFTADKLPADPKYFTVFWTLKGKHILSYDNTVIPTDPRYSLDKDRALNGNASLTISNPSVSDGGLYTCSVNYSSFLMERNISMSVSARPLLSILGKSVQRHTENTLTCMANGFFPNDINVTWYKDGKVLKNQSMGKPRKYDNGTYQVNSTATIITSDDDRNRTFSCRIQHISLQEPLQEEFPLTYESANNQAFLPESSSHVVIIIGIVIAVVLIIGIIAAFIWCRRKRNGKGETGRESLGTSGQSPPEHLQGFLIQGEESLPLADLNTSPLLDNRETGGESLGTSGQSPPEHLQGSPIQGEETSPLADHNTSPLLDNQQTGGESLRTSGQSLPKDLQESPIQGEETSPLADHNTSPLLDNRETGGESLGTSGQSPPEHLQGSPIQGEETLTLPNHYPYSFLDNQRHAEFEMLKSRNNWHTNSMELYARKVPGFPLYQKENNLDESINEEKDQPTESPIAENNKPQSSDQQQTSPVNVEMEEQH